MKDLKMSYIKNIPAIMSILEKQFNYTERTTLNRMRKEKADPYKILISCLLSLRSRDETTERISNESVSIYCRKFGEVVRRYGLIRQTTIYGEVKIEEGFRLNMDNYMEIMMDAVQGDSGSPIIDERFSLLGLVNAGTHHPGITAAVKWNRAMQLVDFLRRSV